MHGIVIVPTSTHTSVPILPTCKPFVAMGTSAGSFGFQRRRWRCVQLLWVPWVLKLGVGTLSLRLVPFISARNMNKVPSAKNG